ncbi:MAG: hypothetical protein WCC63_03370 [Candidatus Bathyarchaeia archaeon]
MNKLLEQALNWALIGTGLVVAMILSIGALLVSLSIRGGQGILASLLIFALPTTFFVLGITICSYMSMACFVCYKMQKEFKPEEIGQTERIQVLPLESHP